MLLNIFENKDTLWSRVFKIFRLFKVKSISSFVEMKQIILLMVGSCPPVLSTWWNIEEHNHNILRLWHILTPWSQFNYLISIFLAEAPFPVLLSNHSLFCLIRGSKVHIDWEKGEGDIYPHCGFRAACSKVEIDDMTGTHKVSGKYHIPGMVNF